MMIFLSALENSSSTKLLKKLVKEGKRIPFGLVSFYYIQKERTGLSNFKMALQVCDKLLVDSGAHSFQKGVRVEWDEYTRQYSEFIEKYDNPKIIGFFEMDVDNVIGYEKVLQLREILEAKTNKIIPVWHKNRGIPEFKKMCKESKSNIVAVTGFKNEDIRDDQYAAFLKYAWKCGKKLHCLGMTRIKVLDKVPFDYVDSSSWKMGAAFGVMKEWSARRRKLITVPNTKNKFTAERMLYKNLMAYIEMTRFYNIKWHKINNDLYFNMGVRDFLLKIKLREVLLPCKKIKEYQLLKLVF